VTKAGKTVVFLAVFTATFVLILAGSVLYLRPALRHRVLDRWRYGQEPQHGIVFRLDVAPSGSLSLVFVNTTEQPISLQMPMGDRAGPEVDVIVKDEKGELVPQSGFLVQSGRGDRVVLAPGGSFTQRLPLEDFVVLGPGKYEVKVERARLAQEEPRLVSNTVTITR